MIQTSLPIRASTPATPTRQLSVVIITQNEAERTARAIASCHDFADEIIVIDGGSSDNTVQRAEALNARVFVNPWPGYAAQRRFGVSCASHRWIFLLDSDEVVGDDLAQALLKWKRQRMIVGSAFKVDRINDFLGRWLPHHMDDQVRLFDRDVHQISDVLVHEGVDVDRAGTEKLPGTLWHYKFRNLYDQVQRFNRYTSLEAQRDYEAGHRFSYFRLLSKPPARFAQKYFLHRFCTRGLAGLAISLLWVSYDLLKEFKLYELAYQREPTQF